MYLHADTFFEIPYIAYVLIMLYYKNGDGTVPQGFAQVYRTSRGLVQAICMFEFVHGAGI